MSVSYGPVVGELCPKPRSGHVAIFCRGQMIIHGGISEESGYLYHSPTDLWSYNTETCSWTLLGTRGKSPTEGLLGSCGACLDDHLFLFGGYQENFGSTSSVHCLNLKTLVWLNLEGKVLGQPPSRRDKLCCWTIGRQICYFGGYGHSSGTEFSKNGEFVHDISEDESRLDFGWNNHFYVLNCSSMDLLEWKQYDVKGDVPCPRAAHASARIGNTGYMFGGRFRQVRRCDMYSIDLKQFEWKRIKATCGPLPEGRSWHILESLGNSYLLLFGGLNTSEEPLHDFWIFDIGARFWSPLQSKLIERMPRIWHSSIHSDENGEVLIFGGCTNSLFTDEPLNHSNSILTVRISPLTLRRLCLDFIMCDFSFYRDAIVNLPITLRQVVEMRLHALQFCMTSDTSCNHTAACRIS